MRNRIRLGVAVAAAGVMLGFGAPTTNAAPDARPVDTVSNSVMLTFASLPVATQATLRAAGVNPSGGTLFRVIELINNETGLCADANPAGPTAGQPGDQVRLWPCFGNPVDNQNQWWVVVPSGGGGNELANLKWGLCLDADPSHGIVNGAQVRLWGCFNDLHLHANQWWDDEPGSTDVLTTEWGDAGKVLEANNTGANAGQAGDNLQIWDQLPNRYQTWEQ